MSDSTAYMITDMLIDTSKSGTAKKLKDLPYNVASKTGTVGKINSSKNTDAFCVSYTSNHTIITYVGDSQLDQKINGSTYPTLINKNILKTLYKNYKPEDFHIPKSITTKNIDLNQYKNNIVEENQNSNNNIEEIFSNNNLPKQNLNKLNLKLEAFNFENRKPILSFFASNNYTYNIKRINEKKEEIISSFSPKDDLKIIKFEDKSAKSNDIYEYFIEICEKSSNIKYQTNKVKLKSY